MGRTAGWVEHRRKTASTWESGDDTLKIGEIGIESDTNKIKLGDGSTTWTNLEYLTVDQVELVAGRISIEEKEYTITSAGWYKFTKTDPISYYSTLANFNFALAAGTEVGSMACCIARNLYQGSVGNKTIQYLPGRSSRTPSLGISLYARLGFDETNSSSAGIVGEVYVPAAGTLRVQKYGAIAGSTTAMLDLVDTMDSVTDGYLPDNVTTATYLEAGTELDVSVGYYSPMPMYASFWKIDSTSGRLMFRWKDIPKPNPTTISLSYSSFNIRDGAGTSYDFDGSETLGTPVVDGDLIYVPISGISSTDYTSLANTNIIQCYWLSMAVTLS